MDSTDSEETQAKLANCESTACGMRALLPIVKWTVQQIVHLVNVLVQLAEHP